ncbi:MAG: hypothetical protein HYZ17_13515 [Betaproteobacteria bacterium]|nr:hypothetical protein [Betaproteobacteria bacterium]
MKTRFAVAALIAALSQTTFAADAYWAQVDTSFKAMLTHEAYAGPTAVTVTRGEIDPAAAYIYAGLRGESLTLVTQSATSDPVLESFEHMLTHQGYSGPTETSIARDGDHEVDRLVFARQQDANRGSTLIAKK